MSDPLLTVNEVAQRLGATPRAVRLWCRLGKLSGARLFGRDWAIPETALKDFKRGAGGRPRKQR